MAASSTNEALIEILRSRMGVEEIPGEKHNSLILGYWQDAGHPEVINDETAWCSACMCSAAKAAGLPFPPVNINPMARSWLTMGVAVPIAEAQVGDVVVWPRGKPNSGQGHVNCIDEIKSEDGKTLVRCIGGNQTSKRGGAINQTTWIDLSTCLPNGVRRLVPATIPDLRKAGSTTIKKGDRVQNIGILATFVAPILAVIKEMWSWVPDVPRFSSIPEGLSFGQQVLEGMNALARLCLDNPWLAGTVACGLVLAWLGHSIKKARVAQHEAGIPIAAEVAALAEDDPELVLEAA